MPRNIYCLLVPVRNQVLHRCMYVGQPQSLCMGHILQAPVKDNNQAAMGVTKVHFVLVGRTREYPLFCPLLERKNGQKSAFSILPRRARRRAIEAPVVLEVVHFQAALLLAHVRTDVLRHVGQQVVEDRVLSYLGGEVTLEPLEYLQRTRGREQTFSKSRHTERAAENER